MSNATRKVRRKARQHPGHHGACFKDGCVRRGRAKMECEICLTKGKKDPFALQCCADHALECREQLKAHILKRHPGMLASWVVSALAGRDME